MKQRWPTLIGAILLIAMFLMLVVVGLFPFQKPCVSLMANGKVIAVAKRSLIQPIGSHASVDLYDGKTKMFSIGKDYWSGPAFIYPFADGTRF